MKPNLFFFLHSSGLDNYSSKIDISRRCLKRNRHANFCKGKIFIILEQNSWRKEGKKKKAVISTETSPGSVTQPFTLSYTPYAITGLPVFVLQTAQWSVLKSNRTLEGPNGKFGGAPKLNRRLFSSWQLIKVLAALIPIIFRSKSLPFSLFLKYLITGIHTAQKWRCQYF